ncbi:MAG: hypothetical protein K8R02_07820 [Anaerohalosphaeraceae bacterium]|nr:hypothetical protein [Anaerohalosphaeraceae bacterium]
MKNDIKKALEIEPWQSLYELNVSTKEKKLLDLVPEKTESQAIGLSAIAKKLAYNIDAKIDLQYRERIEGLDVSARKLEKAKIELLNKGLIKEMLFGKSLFLVPTTKLFEVMGLESPYKRDVSNVHSFSVTLLKKLIAHDPLIQSIKEEVFLGDSNSTGDLLAHMKNGERHVYEVTINSSNVCANAAKLQGKGFAQIIFVCRDYDLKQAVWARIRNGGFDPDFLATIKCVIFSSLISQRKQVLSRSS